jgi:hypothetical protein
MVYLNEGRLQKYIVSSNSRAQEAAAQLHGMKALYTAGPGGYNNEGGSINFQGAMADIMARTSTKAAMLTSIDTSNYQ